MDILEKAKRLIAESEEHERISVDVCIDPGVVPGLIAEIELLRFAIEDIITIIPRSPTHALEVAHRALKSQ